MARRVATTRALFAGACETPAFALTERRAGTAMIEVPLPKTEEIEDRRRWKSSAGCNGRSQPRGRLNLILIVVFFESFSFLNHFSGVIMVLFGIIVTLYNI